jgi:hypothetical protein
MAYVNREFQRHGGAGKRAAAGIIGNHLKGFIDGWVTPPIIIIRRSRNLFDKGR